MTIEQTVEIPASPASGGKRWLTIEVPREVSAGQVILAFTPTEETGKAVQDDITRRLDRYYAGRSPESDDCVKQAAYNLFALEDW